MRNVLNVKSASSCNQSNIWLGLSVIRRSRCVISQPCDFWTDKQPHQCRFSRSVDTDERDPIRRLHRKRDTGEHAPRPEALFNPLNRQDGRHVLPFAVENVF